MVCTIHYVYEPADPDVEFDKDYYQVLYAAEALFDRSGIHLGRDEHIYEVCLDENENVVGASTFQPLGVDELTGEPLFRFSLAVDPMVRRKGIARRLAQSVLDANPEYVAEAWVVNPYMAILLEQLGMEPMGSEWHPDEPFMRRV